MAVKTKPIHWRYSPLLDRARCGVRVDVMNVGAEYSYMAADVTCKRCLELLRRPLGRRRK